MTGETHNTIRIHALTLLKINVNKTHMGTAPVVHPLLQIIDDLQCKFCADHQHVTKLESSQKYAHT